MKAKPQEVMIRKLLGPKKFDLKTEWPAAEADVREMWKECKHNASNDLRRNIDGGRATTQGARDRQHGGP